MIEPIVPPDANLDEPVLGRVDVNGIHYIVTPRRREQQFADGTAIWLHLVLLDGNVRPFLRAFRAHESWVLFDLRHLASQLGAEIPRAPEAYVPVLVFKALKAAFPTAGALIADARVNALGLGMVIPAVYVDPRAGQQPTQGARA